MTIDFVLNAKIKLSFSRLHHQFFVISGLVLRTNLNIYRVAFCWPIFPRYIGMFLFSLHAVSARKITVLLKTMNVNITSNSGNCDFKIHLHHVKQIAK